MKRIVRLFVLAAATAGAVAAVRALRRSNDPLPSPASSPSAPWPPLRPEAVAEDRATATPAPVVPQPVAPQPVAPQPVAPQPVAPEPDEPTPATPAGGAGWVEPVDGECPDGHPIKAKMSSKIFHSPGQLNYERTTPDRCYVDADAAEADGLRAAKR